jgi:glutathione peroxidase
MKQGKKSNNKSLVLNNEKHILPQQNFYSLTATKNNGEVFSFQELKEKKVLIVNTASDCGYTPQYADLQKLYEENKEHLIILGFPSNDFKEQEKAGDEEIAQFCSINFGVTFPLMKKSVVIASSSQNEIFIWLSNSKKNGWCNQIPEWNFSKYLIDENGVLLNYFASAVSPLSDEILQAIKK